jgi:adenine-specific DNA-methyltransferase
LNNLPGKIGRITENFSPYSKIGRKFFTTNNAMKIDSIRKEIEKYKEDSNLYYFLLCSLLETADSYSNTTGVYGAFLKNFDKRSNSDLILKPYVPAIGNKGTCYNEDINTLIQNLQGDILYLDPPYNSRQYGANYHILNYIVNDNFVISKKSNKETLTGLGEYNKSQFSSKNKAKLAMEELISKSSGFDRIYMSYNNEGILDKNEIKEIFEKHGDYSLVTKEHKRFKSNSESDNRNVLEQLHILKR